MKIKLILSFLISFTTAHAHESLDERGSNATDSRTADAHSLVFKNNPQLVASIMKGGGFGSELSWAVANSLYSRTNENAINDVRKKIKIESIAPRTWLLRLPIVNVVVFETDDGLVLIDSGYAPAGPALVETLKKINTKPVHTIIHTHFHADHAFGAWAFMTSEHKPQIIAEERFVEQMEYDMRAWGLNARNNQKKPLDVPKNWAMAIKPTITFHGALKHHIGGEEFVLTHSRGETDDQIWVSVPGRKIVASADYFQSFLPNAGNGKRRQRYTEEWAQALRSMADLEPEFLLPAHGAALRSAEEIQRRLKGQARMLDSIAQQVVDGLNSGKRRDQVLEKVALPADLVNQEDARELYVSAKDIARMVASEYSGWWDDVPSHWSPAPLAAEAKELAQLAGGSEKMIHRALALVRSHPALASHLADWAWYADSENLVVAQGALEVYSQRVTQPLPTQEALVYAEHMTRLQSKITELSQK